MRPVLFYLFGLPVHAYGTALAISFLLGTIMASRDAERRGIGPDHVMNVAVLSAVSGVIGARILFVLLNLGYYLESPLETFNIAAGGLSLHGGFVLAVLVGIWYCRHYGVSPGVMADVTAPAAIFGIGLTRIGCFLNGCCFGTPVSAPWGIDCSYYHDTLRYPTQLYEAGLDFLLFAYLFARRRQGHFDGWLMFQLVGWYSIVRFVVEAFREVPRVLGPLSPAQLASIALGIAAFVISARLDYRRGNGHVRCNRVDNNTSGK